MCVFVFVSIYLMSCDSFACVCLSDLEIAGLQDAYLLREALEYFQGIEEIKNESFWSTLEGYELSSCSL